MVSLTGKQRRFLRGLGHRLKPTLNVGKGGVSDSVVQQLDTDLEAHELVKVRLGKSFEDEPAEALDVLCERCGAVLAGTVGRTALVYRPREKDPAIRLPRDDDNVS